MLLHARPHRACEIFQQKVYKTIEVWAIVHLKNFPTLHMLTTTLLFLLYYCSESVGVDQITRRSNRGRVICLSFFEFFFFIIVLLNSSSSLLTSSSCNNNDERKKNERETQKTPFFLLRRRRLIFSKKKEEEEEEEEDEEKLVSRDKRHVFWSDDASAEKADRGERCGV